MADDAGRRAKRARSYLLALVSAALILSGCSGAPPAGDPNGGPSNGDPPNGDPANGGDTSEITLSISPSGATLRLGQRQLFTAVLGGSDAGVTWITDCGELQSDGESVTYFAPWQPGTCTVTATSVTNPGVSAAVEVVVTRVPDADNLVANPGFDVDLSGWTVFEDAGTPRAVWSPDDAAGSESSGSAEVSVDVTGGGTLAIGLTLCFATQPSQLYAVGASSRAIAGSNDENVFAALWVRTFAEEGCAWGDGPVSFNQLEWSAELDGDDWAYLGREFTTPEQATSISLAFGVASYGGVAAETTVRLDEVFLVAQD